jgi:hypothetical protein
MAKAGERNQRVPVGRIAGVNDGEGVTYKRFVRMGGGRGEKGRVLPSRTYMLKPYYEDFNDKYSYYPYPTAGWSDLATQALMHAGGLGHMSQVVHAHLPESSSSVYGQHSGAETPVLAVEIAKGHQRIGNFDDARIVTDSSREEAAKLAAMDFLTNNGDRHDANLLVNVSPTNDPDQDGVEVSIDSLLAIDHGRSFHYRTALDGGGEDNLLDYFTADGYSLFELDNNVHRHDVMHAIAGWWGKHGSAIRIEMKKQLKGIKIPGMIDNVNDHFGYRADALDKMVKTLKAKGAKVYNSGKPNKKAYAELSVPVSTHTPRGPIWDPDKDNEPRKVMTLATNGHDFKTKRDTAGNTVFEGQED